MTILAPRIVFLVFLWVTLGIELAMYAFPQGFSYWLVGKSCLSRWLNNMALLGAIHFYCHLMRDLIFIRMAIMTFIASMRAGLEHLVIDIIQPELALFIDSAQPPVLVANQAVDLIIGLGNNDRPANNYKYNY